MDKWELVSLIDRRDEIRSILATRGDRSPAAPTLPPVAPFSATSGCSKCPGFRYVTPEEFREHCRSEWHVSNLKRLPGENLSFDHWSRLDSVSDPSESSSESDVDHDPPTVGKLILNQMPFVPIEGTCLAVPSVIGDPSVLLDAEYVSVMLLRSGRFAGAVWDNTGNVLAHTSFKRYTIRRKAGGSQSKNDNSKNSPANSVGAQIRRAQEKKLAEEVAEVVGTTWRKYFESPRAVVFVHASKSQVDDVLVGPLAKGKEKCRVLPIPVSLHDPTFAEVCRAHRLLTQVAIARTPS